jgi:predicted amidohydrolase YtcJ
MTESEADVRLPPGLIDAVLHLVRTGPVLLGGYSLAEMVAVDAVVEFLDQMPSDEEVAGPYGRWPRASSWWPHRKPNASRSVATRA